MSFYTYKVYFGLSKELLTVRTKDRMYHQHRLNKASSILIQSKYRGALVKTGYLAYNRHGFMIECDPDTTPITQKEELETLSFLEENFGKKSKVVVYDYSSRMIIEFFRFSKVNTKESVDQLLEDVKEVLYTLQEAKEGWHSTYFVKCFNLNKQGRESNCLIHARIDL